MPTGRKCPFPPPADKSAGSTGSTQGDSTVTIPARKAKKRRMSISPKNKNKYFNYIS